MQYFSSLSKIFILYISVVFVLFLNQITLSAENTVDMVEGIFYLDETPVSVEIIDGKIDKIIRKEKLDDPANENIYIAPGLIDNQVNGYAGVSFSLGGSNLSVEGVRKATRALWKDGITSYLPTLTTNSHEILLKNFTIMGEAINDPEIRGSIPGFHLEGPYISPIDGYRGAHPKRWVRSPDWNEFLELNKASGNHILEVSLAPETDGALEFIRKCRSKGIIVALAHHNGSPEIIKQAIDEGASVATHLGNGCANTINRHLNPLWPQLADDRLNISIICDGFHLRPEEIQVFYKAKGTDRTIVTSDVTHFAAMQPGFYKGTEGETIELTKEGMLRYPEQNVLYGSASPISKGVGHIMKVTGCSLADAVQMASTNSARLYGLDDRGEIEPGKRADLVLFSIENYVLHIKKTIVAGKVVYEAE